MMITKNKTNRHFSGKSFLSQSLHNESGAALILALLAMVVMISMVPVAMQMSAGETDRVSDYQGNRQAFFAAEAGLEHAKYLTEQVALSAILAGPDDLVTTTPSDPENDDNGTFGITGATLVTRPDGNVYDEVSFSGSTYFIRAYDNNDGDNDPTADADQLIILSAVGVVNGVTSTVEALVYNPSGLVSAISTNDNLAISGDPDISGACGSVHTNGDMDNSGNPDISQDSTASGSYNPGGTVGGVSGGGYADVPVPLLDPTTFEGDADYKLKSDGKVYDSNDNFVHDATSSDWEGWNYSSPKWTQTGVGAGGSIDGSLYVEGDVVIGSDVGSPGTPWQVTIIATGFIEVSGNPDMENYKNGSDPDEIQNIFMMAGTDLKFNGNSTVQIEGLFYAKEQLEISGNPDINGAIIAYDFASSEGLVSENKISGNPTITFGCGLAIPGITTGIDVVSWNQVE